MNQRIARIETDFFFLVMIFFSLSQVVVAISSIICLLFLSSVGGFIGIWVALTIYMALRAIVGILR